MGIALRPAGCALLLFVVVTLACGAWAGEEPKADKPARADSAAPAEPASVTVAVLQFKNLCGDTALDWLGVGFAESLCTKLSNVPGIQLVEREQLSKALKELQLQDTAVVDPKTAGKLGKVIGARYVIVGSFQKAGDSFKADARRVEVETSIASNGVEATGTYAKVFDVQSDLALKLVESFGKKVTAEQKQEIAKPETASVTAYELNAKGLAAGQRLDYDEASSLFSRAIEADPKYTEAYYNRGVARFMRQDFTGASSDLNKAIEMNPKDPAAYISRGMCYLASMNFVQGLADLNKAIEVAPGDFRGYGARALAYMNAGNAVMALPDVNKVIKLNPKLPDGYFARAMCNLALMNADKVESDVKKGLELGGSPPPQLVQMLTLMGMDISDPQD